MRAVDTLSASGATAVSAALQGEAREPLAAAPAKELACAERQLDEMDALFGAINDDASEAFSASLATRAAFSR